MHIQVVSPRFDRLPATCKRHITPRSFTEHAAWISHLLVKLLSAANVGVRSK